MPATRTLRLHLLAACAAGLLAAAGAHAAPPVLSSAEAGLVDRISADSMRGHLSFLASDALEGRGTPSRGLDIAAEYIAAQFRRAGLEPLGDDGYFQTADWRVIAPERERARYADAPEPLLVRNVAGVLRGSDPELAKTYVLVTAKKTEKGSSSGGSPTALLRWIESSKFSPSNSLTLKTGGQSLAVGIL